MDTNGFMPPTYFHRIGAYMLQGTDIPIYLFAVPSVEYFHVFCDSLNGIGGGFEAPVMHYSFLSNPQAFHGDVFVAAPPARQR
ncbi:MAG: hypothetical protein ABIR84_04830 [Candidatus Nitrotoga sp.]